MRLGFLIRELAALDQNAMVHFRACGQISGVPDGGNPGEFRSYRGYYDRLALGSGPRAKTVGELLGAARDAVGAPFDGYKGGEFTMDENTALYAANWGESYGDQIVGVEKRGRAVLLLVAHAEEW